jgi:hypothetical protein
MSDYVDFKSISSILHGYSPNGKRVTPDFRLERYMIVLYAALHLPLFTRHKKRDGKNEGFTLYSLEGVANTLGYDFDRSKTSKKIYKEQKKERKVGIKEIGKTKPKKTIYMLTKEGNSYCEKCIKLLLEAKDSSELAWNPHTENVQKILEHALAKVQKMSVKEQERWFKKNPGVLFRQPTKEEHELDLLLQKIKSLT